VSWSPTGPGGSTPDDPRAWMQQQLFQRRVVLLSGTLDAQSGHEVGAALMTLDAIGDGPVSLQIDCEGGSLDEALALMDIIDLLGVPVHASCVGQATGTAVGVLAVAGHRSMSPHARLRLVEPSWAMHGRASQLEQLASAHADQWRAFCARLSEATGCPLDQLLADTAGGRYLSPDEALEYGLIDEVARPDARIFRMPGRTIGFSPR
jgi:ATP-dependent Clp protease protease subunit